MCSCSWTTCFSISSDIIPAFDPIVPSPEWPQMAWQWASSSVKDPSMKGQGRLSILVPIDSLSATYSEPKLSLGCTERHIYMQCNRGKPDSDIDRGVICKMNTSATWMAEEAPRSRGAATFTPLLGWFCPRQCRTIRPPLCWSKTCLRTHDSVVNLGRHSNIVSIQ